MAATFDKEIVNDPISTDEILDIALTKQKEGIVRIIENNTVDVTPIYGRLKCGSERN